MGNYSLKLLKSVTICISSSLLQFWEVATQFVHAILPKSRRMVINYQLNNLAENCFKTTIFGLKCADFKRKRLQFLILLLFDKFHNLNHDQTKHPSENFISQN